MSMENRHYILHDHTAIEIFFGVNNTYKIAKTPGKYAQKLLNWLSRNGIIEPYKEKEIKYREVTIDTKSLFEMVQEQINHNLCNHRNPRLIVIGGKCRGDFHKELRGDFLRAYIDRFCCFSNGQGDIKFMGVDVLYVPYADCAVVLCDEDFRYFTRLAP